MNQLDTPVRDWGWWNRAYSRLLIRTRGYRLVSLVKTLPQVEKACELAQHENGAFLWLERRKSLHQLRPPKVALGEHAAYVVDHYQRDFAPREDRPFVAYIRNPLLYGRQFSILDSRHHAFEECFTRDRRWREGVPKTRKRPIPKKVPGTYLFGITEYPKNYAHFFCDVLPCNVLFEEAGLAGRFPSILPPPGPTFASEAFRLLGLEATGSIRWDDTCWEMDGIYFASHFKKFCSWTPESAAWIRGKLCPGLDQKPPGQKLFYISRRHGNRPALNEDAILASLKPWGITVVESERLSLQEQIELFSEAGLIMGAHGAGIQNALWAPRGCMVLEFISPRYITGAFWTLAESLGHHYGLVTGDTPQEGHPSQIGSTYDPVLINRALEVLARSR